MPHRKRNRENWQELGGQMGRLKWKLVLGGITVLSILGLLFFTSQKSLHSILLSVEELSSPKENEDILNKLMLEMANLEWQSNSYIASRDMEELDLYFEKADKINVLIDSIAQTFGKGYPEKMDSLSRLYADYVASLDAYIQIKTSNSLAYEYQILQMIRSEKSDIKQSQKSEIVQPEIKPEEQVELTAKEKRKLKRAEKNKSIASKPEIEPMPVDSSLIKKYDNLVEQVQSKVQSGLHSKIKWQENTVQRENEVLSNQLGIIEQIQNILSDLESKENEITGQLSREAEQKILSNTQTLRRLTLIIIVIIIVLAIITFSDVSKSIFYRDKLQEARLEAEKLALSKEDFLSSMSHEIRTPLNSIIGFAEQLNEGNLHPGQRAKVHALIRSGDHLISLVNDILDFTKIESGSLKLEYIGFSPVDIIDEVIEVLEPEAMRKGLDLQFEPGDTGRILVKGDPVRLRQILLNIVGNAVKFTAKGSVKIELKQEPISGNKSYISFWVSDTGVGMSKEKLSRIFTKFDQGDLTTNRRYGGSGLGLSISKKLVEMQAGTIKAESKPGIGSVFSFRIPYVITNENQYNAMEPVAQFEAPLKDVRILVVDDDPMAEILLKPVFEKNEAFVRFEKNPLEALTICRTEAFNVIMSDLQMPQMDGLRFLEQVKEMPIQKDTHCIICTGNVRKKIDSPYVDYILYKPYRMSELMHVFGKIYPSPLDIDTVDMDHSFSLEYFNTFAGGDPFQLQQFVELFIQNARIEIDKIKKSFAQNDTSSIGESAHLLKNTYGQLKAGACMLIIARLERLVDEKYLDDETISGLIEDLDKESEKLFAELHESLLGN